MADVCPCNFSLVFFGEFVGGWLSQISDSKVIKFKNLFIKYFFFNSILLSAFNLDFYTDVLDLNFLLDHIKDNPFTQKYKKLNEALVGLVEDYGLVSFKTLDIQVHVGVIKILVGAVQQRNVACVNIHVHCVHVLQFIFSKMTP